MKEFMKIATGMVLAVGVVVSGVGMAHAKDIPAMGGTCTLGKPIFYGELTRTKSEEKLCKVSDTEYYFYTRNGDSAQIASTKIGHVTKVEVSGVVGKTVGYDFNLLSGDTIKFRALYRGESKSPFAGYFIINDYAIDLEPLSILIN